MIDDSSTYRALSGLFANFSEVFLAVLVVLVFSQRFDLSKLPVILLGVTSTFVFGYLSVLFARWGKL